MPNDAPRVRHARSAFRIEYSVEVTIDAPPARVWELLTDATRFTRWNSTVSSVEGTIAEGETIALKAKVAPDRTFKLKVGDVVPEKAMTWSDGMAPFFRGVRTFALDPDGEATRFSMTEVFKGVMLPMIAGSLPDFGPVFEQYARDLKRASEAP
ncbi:MAG: SRPBCC domain-containing protein [Polyangiaceae bacterium]